MKRHIREIYRKTTKNEFKRQLKFLILVTLGFTIAFTWRQTVFDISKTILQVITHVEETASLSILASVLITLVSLGVIYLTSRWLKDKPDAF
jgi:hypothetical protein